MSFELPKITASLLMRTAGWSAGLTTAYNLLTSFVSSSIDEFTELERGASEVVTLLGKDWTGTVDMMMDKIRQFGAETGRTFEQVYNSAYQAVSASVPEQDLFPFLDKAHELALATNSELNVATDILTTTMNAYGLTVDDVDKKSEELFATVRLGKTQLNELNAYAYQLIPTSAALGFELDEVLAVFTALTKQGVPSAQAFQRTNAMLVDLSREGSKADKNLRSLGHGGMKDIVDAGGGMVDILELIDEWVQTTDKSYTDFFTRQEAGMGAASAASERGRAIVVADLEDIASSNGEVAAAADLMEDTLSTEWEKTAVAAANLRASVGESFEGLNRKIAFEVRGIIESATNMWNAIFDAGPQDTTTTLGAGGDQNQRDLVNYMNQLAQQTEGDSAGALIRMGEWSSRLRGDDWASAATRDTMPLLPGIQTQSFAGLQKFDWHGQSWLWNPVRREFFNEGTGTIYTADQVADMAASNVRTSQPSAHPATGYMDPRTAGGGIPVTTTATTDTWAYLSHQQQYSDWIQYGEDDDSSGGGSGGGGGASGESTWAKAMRLLRQGIVARVNQFANRFPLTELTAEGLYDYFSSDQQLLDLAEPTGKTKAGLTELFGEVVALKTSDPFYQADVQKAREREQERLDRERDEDYRAYLSRRDTFGNVVSGKVGFWQSNIFGNEAFGGQTLRETFEDDPEFKAAALEFFGRRTGGDADAALELGLQALEDHWLDVQNSTEFLTQQHQDAYDAQMGLAEDQKKWAEQLAEENRKLMEARADLARSEWQAIRDQKRRTDAHVRDAELGQPTDIFGMLAGVSGDEPISKYVADQFWIDIGSPMAAGSGLDPTIQMGLFETARIAHNQKLAWEATLDQFAEDHNLGVDDGDTAGALSRTLLSDISGPTSRLFYGGSETAAQFIRNWECDNMVEMQKQTGLLSTIAGNTTNMPPGRNLTVHNYQAGGLSRQSDALI